MILCRIICLPDVHVLLVTANSVDDGTIDRSVTLVLGALSLPIIIYLMQL